MERGKGMSRVKTDTERQDSSSEPQRVSLKDIAKELGISQTAVSFAINDKPGVSRRTKRRVKDAAARLGWSPVYAAQALGSSRTMTIGFAPARSIDAFQTETFMLHFMAGIHASLSDHGYGLLFRPCRSLEEELTTYEDWARRKRVDGVILVDSLIDDPRPGRLKALGMPAVLAGGPDTHHELPSLSIDDSKTMTTILKHLRAQGHRRIAYLSGDPKLDYSRARASAFHHFAQGNGLDSAIVKFTDFDPDEAVNQTLSLFSGTHPYTAFIYENEILAAASLRSLNMRRSDDAAVDLPARTDALPGIVSFEDSFICQSTSPSITAVHRDAGLYGTKVANLLLKVFDGGAVSSNRRILTPKLVIRESTARSVR